MIDIISQTQTAQSDFKANIKDKIGRQIDLLDDSMNKEEKNRLCNDPEVNYNKFFHILFYKTIGISKINCKKNFRLCAFGIKIYR